MIKTANRRQYIVGIPSRGKKAYAQSYLNC